MTSDVVDSGSLVTRSPEGCGPCLFPGLFLFLALFYCGTLDPFLNHELSLLPGFPKSPSCLLDDGDSSTE